MIHCIQGTNVLYGCFLLYALFLQILLLKLYVVEDSGIFRLYEPWVGRGIVANLDFNSCVPKSWLCLPCSAEITLYMACASLPQRQNFVDKMLRASYTFIKIAAVKERDKICTIREKVTSLPHFVPLFPVGTFFHGKQRSSRHLMSRGHPPAQTIPMGL